MTRSPSIIKQPHKIIFLATIALLLIFSTFAWGAQAAEQKPILLKTMGSLMFGGTVTHKDDGETFHGDHGYAQYYIPQNARQYPLIMWHGMGQSGKSWESTPDGREGFQAILTRNDWPVYIIDQPRRGRAGYTSAGAADPGAVPTTARESSVWNAFRNGVWTPPQKATMFDIVQFPRDAASIEQFFRQQTPDTGVEPMTAEYRQFMGKTMAELLKLTGPSILITHSHSVQYGWYAAMAAQPGEIKAIIAYEPGAFTFPENERPAQIPARAEMVDMVMEPRLVPMEEFKKLTRIPIVIYYGDNISKEASEIFSVDLWRVANMRAKQFVDAVNRHGGDATLVFLPELGMKGNTHAPFADLNNIEVASLLEKFLHDKKLDGSSSPHSGPSKRVLEKATIPLR
ncbi:alpha/beta fold hydrolase [Desulfovibrio sp.]|uniref:alpha/beta hydrolase n=1 Tax=Desulfovibrio sp. TaxID=885 RepID=UPI0025C53C89|nr:alpha/beta fold hydrolase [Desulfovibrio sp.]